MAALWGVKNRVGEILQDFTAASRIEVGLKVVSTRYDAFRLQVSSSYRQLFNRALSQILDKKHWRIVRVRRPPAAELSQSRAGHVSLRSKKRRTPRGGHKAPGGNQPGRHREGNRAAQNKRASSRVVPGGASSYI